MRIQQMQTRYSNLQFTTFTFENWIQPCSRTQRRAQQWRIVSSNVHKPANWWIEIEINVSMICVNNFTFGIIEFKTQQACLSTDHVYIAVNIGNSTTKGYIIKITNVEFTGNLFQNWLQRKTKQECAKRVTLLRASSWNDGVIIELYGRLASICLHAKSVYLRTVLSHRFKHTIPTQAVKCVTEIQFNNNVITSTADCFKIPTRDMNSSLNPAIIIIIFNINNISDERNRVRVNGCFKVIVIRIIQFASFWKSEQYINSIQFRHLSTPLTCMASGALQ